MIKNNKYYVDRVNSSKATTFVAYYHYSHISFKKAKINLGIYRIEDNLLVGVMQWGCSAQEHIRLNRYVKEPITKDQYLELNRFCMADSEGRNSESQAISLGIKWIKQNMPEIKLLVSYAGRKEGNYGYIYQATSWLYLGHFISDGFWTIDNRETHSLTLWYHYKHNFPNGEMNLVEGLCTLYNQVIKTFTKQFIYIKILDKSYTPASEILPYPKPSTDFPIKTKEIVYKDEPVVESYSANTEMPLFYWQEEKYWFTRRTLIRRGEISKMDRLYKIAMFDIDGNFERLFDSFTDAANDKYLIGGIRKSCLDLKRYKDKYFRFYTDDCPEGIDVDPICIIDNISFVVGAEAARYLGVSRQAFSQAKERKAHTIKGKKITWI